MDQHSGALTRTEPGISFFFVAKRSFTGLFLKYFSVSTSSLGLTLEKNKPPAQAAGQTLPDATPPVGKVHPFSKITVNFEPIQRFR